MFNFEVYQRGESSKSVPIVEQVKDDEWRFRTYKLTPEGRAMVSKSEAPKSETWYRVSGSNVYGEEFARSTDSCLVSANGRKQAKHTEWASYFPTPESALAHIRRELVSRVETAEAALAYARKALLEFDRKEKLS